MDPVKELFIVLAEAMHPERGTVEGLAAAGHAVSGIFPLITADEQQLHDRIIPAAQAQANLTRSRLQVVRFLRSDIMIVIQPEPVK